MKLRRGLALLCTIALLCSEANYVKASEIIDEEPLYSDSLQKDFEYNDLDDKSDENAEVSLEDEAKSKNSENSDISEQNESLNEKEVIDAGDSNVEDEVIKNGEETEEIEESEDTQEEKTEWLEDEELLIEAVDTNMTLLKASSNNSQITEDVIYNQAPSYLVNPAYEKIMTNCADMTLEAIASDDGSDDGIAAYMFALKEGTGFLWHQLWSSVGLKEDYYTEFQDNAAKELVYEYLNVNDNLSKEIKKVQKEYKAVNVVYDISKSEGKRQLLNDLKKANSSLSEADAKKMYDSVTSKSDTFMKYTGSGLEACAMMIEVIEMQEVELQAIDDLIVMNNNLKDPAMRDALARLRTDITTNIGEYIIATYVKDKVLVELQKHTAKYADEIIGKKVFTSGAWSLGTKITKFIGKAYESHYVSVSDKVYASLLQQYWQNSESLVIHYRYKIIYEHDTSEDTIRYYQSAVKLNIACTKLLLLKSRNLIKNKDQRLYNKMGMWADSLGKDITYESYMNSCIGNVQKAVDNGELTITLDSSIKKDKNGNVIDENYDSSESIRLKFEAIQNQYKPNVGQVWDENFGGTYQCFGFARMVFYNLFGESMPAMQALRYGEGYRYMTTDNVVIVGQLVGSDVNTTNVRSLMQNGKLGDILQTYGNYKGNGNPHTMVFVAADENGVTVYDNNSTLNCTIRQYTMNWNDFVSRYGTGDSKSKNGVTLYRAANYAEIYGDGSDFVFDDSVNFVIQDGVLIKYNGWQSFVDIPDTVTAIGDSAFENNKNMMSVNIPDSVTSIGKKAFYGCSNLLGVEIPDTVESIGVSAFEGCSNLRTVYLTKNEKYTEISERCFYGAGVGDLVIPENIVTINGDAFNGCSKMTSLSLPENISLIKIRAFYGCSSLTELTLPDSLKTLGCGAFSDCSSLTLVKLSANIEKLEGNTFRYCTSLSSINIPKSLSSASRSWLGSDGLSGHGEGEFYGCTNLKSITFEEGMKKIPANICFNCANLEQIYMPNSIEVVGSDAFANCKGLKNLSLPSNVKTLETRAFYGCTGINELSLPDKLNTLGCGAFSDCTGLTKVKLPANLQYMQGNTFRYCTGLKNITIPKSLISASKNWIGEDGLGGVGSGEFYGCSNLKSIEFEKGITEIVPYICYNCSQLEEIVIPDSVSTIRGETFVNCAGLKTLTIPNKVKEIKSRAFYGCTGLEELVLPDNVEILGGAAFSDCTGLKNITLSSNLKSLGGNTFRNCTGLTSITIPKSIQVASLSYITDGDKYGQGEFFGCNNLKEVNFAEGMTVIPAYILYNCSSVEQINLPDTINKIGSDAFKNVTNAKYYIVGDDKTTFNTLINYGIAKEDIIYASEIVYYLNGGELAELSPLVYSSLDEEITIPDPIYAHHKFVGWFSDEKMTSSIGERADNVTSISCSSISGKLHLYAKWSGPYYTVTFDAGEYGTLSEAANDSIDLKIDTPIGQLPNVDIKPEYDENNASFIGWYTKDGKLITEESVFSGDNYEIVLEARYRNVKKKVESPYASYDSGIITRGTEVSLYTIRNNANVYFTVDGSEPNLGSSIYVEPIVINEDTVLKAIAVKDGFNNSDIVTYNYAVEDSEITQGDVKDSDLPEGDSLEEKINSIPEDFWIADIEDQVYTGKQIKPEFRVYYGKKLLVEKQDYTVSYKNNTNVGTAQIIVIGKGNYTGKFEKTFSITPLDITENLAELEDLYVSYNSKKAQKPSFTVKANGKKLSINKEYKVEWVNENNETNGGCKEAKSYDVVISGINNYQGSITKHFVISNPEQVLISNVSIAKVPDQKYDDWLKDGEDNVFVAPELNVTYKKNPLVAGKDYTVEYKNNSSIGTATAVIHGTGTKYTGSKSISFKIVGTNITSFKINGLDKNGYIYTGDAIEPAITVDKTTIVNGIKNTTTLVKDTDYVISYQSNNNVGKAAVVVKGIGSYSGQIKATYNIKAFDFAKNDANRITVSYDLNCDYITGGVCPDVTVRFNGTELILNKDFTVKYNNNKAVKAADATDKKGKLIGPNFVITGKGNYKGSYSAQYFTIEKQDISNLSIDVLDKIASSKSNAYVSKPVVTDILSVKKNVLKQNTDYEAPVYQYDEDTIVYNYDKKLKQNVKVYRYADDVVDKLDIIPAETVIKVTVKGKNNYEGSLSTTYRILASNTDISKVTVKIPDQLFTGKEICPGKDSISIYMTINKQQVPLEKKDYEIVSYSNNLKKGTATIVLHGLGEYGGTKKATFKIVNKSMFYTISFNNNQGKGSMKTLQITTDSSKLTKNSFTRKGYTFVGWNTDKNANTAEYIDQEVVNVLGKRGMNLQLYAIWSKDTYTITYHLEDDAINDANNHTNYQVDSEKIPLKSASREHYVFAGWYKDPKFRTKITEIKTGSVGNLDLYPKWTPAKYSVSFNANGGTGTTKKYD